MSGGLLRSFHTPPAGSESAVCVSQLEGLMSEPTLVTRYIPRYNSLLNHSCLSPAQSMLQNRMKNDILTGPPTALLAQLLGKGPREEDKPDTH